MGVFEINILYCCDLDIYSYSENFNICHSCWNKISRSSKPKFGMTNKIPQLYCQHYPCMLEGLTFTEKVIIVLAHLVISILILRPNNNFNLKSYRSVCKHSMLLPQNSKLLFDLLSWKITPVDKIVKNICGSKSLLRPKQWSAFVSIQEHYIIGVLSWLIINNFLYKNTKINHRFFETWNKDLILSGIIDTIIYCYSNQLK